MATAITSQGNGWRYFGTVNIHPSIGNSVTAMKFDPDEEILWVGSSSGKVSSLLPHNQFSRYTAFVVARNSPVNALEVTDSLVFSLTNTTLRATSKQAIPVFKHSSASMKNLAAMYHLPGSSTILLGGYQNKILFYDFQKNKELRTIELNSEEVSHIIRYNGTNIFTADNKGKIQVRCPKNGELVSTIQCHTGEVLDFDVQQYKVITCGTSLCNTESHDRYIKVYDTRMNAFHRPIQTFHPPRFARFVPSYCERICAITQSGYPQSQNTPWLSYHSAVQMVDTVKESHMIDIHMETSVLTSFDCSSSKNFIALGNHNGDITMFSDRDHPMVNENSKETIFAAPPMQPPLSFSIDDGSQPLGLIPFGFSQEELLSDWPYEYTQIVHRRRKPPPEYTYIKSIHYADQVKNPRVDTKLKLHNIVPVYLDQGVIEISPSSEQEERTESPIGKQTIKVSKLYKKRPKSSVKRGENFVDETLEMYKWNTIHHVTMQSRFDMNLVANAVVQVIYFLSPIRNIVFRHICAEDSCITCELHFLFTDFSSKTGKTIDFATTNLAWTLARNGVNLKSGGMLSAVNQVITKMLKDVADKDLTSSIYSKFDRHFCCVRCRALQTVEKDADYLLTLKYGSIHQATLCQLIEKSLHLGAESGERECEDCKLMTRMECKRKVRDLAPILLINTDTSAEGFVDFWRRQLGFFERKPDANRNAVFGNVPNSPSEKKICRFGADCRHQNACKFFHGRIDWFEEQAKLLEDVDGEWKHYIPSRISAQVSEGIIRITDISDAPNYDEPDAVIYELEAMVHVIGNGQMPADWTHPVAMLNESPVTSTAWTLVNEQLVSRLHHHEARHVDGRWKLPALLTYQKKDFAVQVTEQNIPDEMFFAEKNVAPNGADSEAIKSIDELPKEGEFVGLDAEFIKIKTDLLEFGGKSAEFYALGRASCVDSTGEKIIFDDHVVLSPEVEVTNYLTKYSGIVDVDLVASTSKKYLTTHKRLLLRMHVMIQRGVVFVGHGLDNDFDVINVHIAEPQVIDTVKLMRKENGRLLSLRFLAKEILGEIIQSAEHDSVVDARYALKLYRRYMEMIDQGIIDAEIRRIYACAARNSPLSAASPLGVLTNSKPTGGPAEPAPKSI